MDATTKEAEKSQKLLLKQQKAHKEYAESNIKRLKNQLKPQVVKEKRLLAKLNPVLNVIRIVTNQIKELEPMLEDDFVQKKNAKIAEKLLK